MGRFIERQTDRGGQTEIQNPTDRRTDRQKLLDIIHVLVKRKGGRLTQTD